MITHVARRADGSFRVEIDGAVLYVPDDPRNADRAAIDAWVAAGGTIEPYEPPVPPVPASITFGQMIRALRDIDLITHEEAVAAGRSRDLPTQIQAAFSELDTADAEQAELLWVTISVVERAHPLVALLAAANDMSDGDVDDFFRLAAGL